MKYQKSGMKTQKVTMNSFTIDPSVFIPPLMPDNSNSLIEFKEQIKYFFNRINKCYEFIHIEGISVYVFRGNSNIFNDKYKKNANKTGLPIDLLKKRIDDIQLFNMPKLHYGDKIGVKKYYFQDWFEIENLKYIKSEYKPLIQNNQINNAEFIYRLNYIGILNNFVYKNNSTHYIIINESINNISLDSQQISFLIKKNSISNEKMYVNIQTLNINEINLNPRKRFNKLIEVYNYAKEELIDYVLFGKDVQEGIKTIRDSAGPPDRVFAYLETLKDFCIYKRCYNSVFSDMFILQSFGCICSYENKNIFNDEKAKRERMFDNGNNERELFNLHLKPNTFTIAEEQERKERTVRIYISWNEIQKKVIVGWIGKHPYNPQSKPLSVDNSNHNKI